MTYIILSCVISGHFHSLSDENCARNSHLKVEDNIKNTCGGVNRLY